MFILPLSCYQINNLEANVFEITLENKKFVDLNKIKTCFIELLKLVGELENTKLENHF